MTTSVKMLKLTKWFFGFYKKTFLRYLHKNATLLRVKECCKYKKQVNTIF